MLEVGTGFHPELTGRENVYVNGAILGMTPDEINKKFEAIVEFSGVGKFLDTMVKYYSSGMYVRLAFAVAAYLEPEILIVDEVLSIGDADFQSKCLAKMEDLTKGGRTVLFVSHNMAAIKSLCPTTMLLDKGSIKMVGSTESVVESYLKSKTPGILEHKWNDPPSAPGNDLIRIHRIWIENQPDGELESIFRNHPIRVGVEYWNQSDAKLSISLHFIIEGSIVVFSSGPSDHVSHAGSGDLILSTCTIPANFLNPNFYQIQLLAFKDKNQLVFTLNNALYFDVMDNEQGKGWYSKEPGIVTPALHWQSQIVGLNDQRSHD
jgi:lipopolysaccharide transport system ATP-binding protein